MRWIQHRWSTVAFLALLPVFAFSAITVQMSLSSRHLKQNGTIGGVAFSSDGKQLIVGSEVLDSGGLPQGQVKWWDVKSRKLLRTLKIPGSQKVGLGLVSLALSPDNLRIATGSWTVDEPAGVRVWSVRTGKLERTLKAQGVGIYSLAFSPDAKMLAAGSGRGGGVDIWDVRNGKLLRRFRWHYDIIVNSVAFSRDGKLLASGAERGEVRVWSTHTGALKRKLQFSTWNIPSVAFSPIDRDILAIVDESQNAKIRLHNSKMGKLLRTIGFKGSVNAMDFSPDGKVVAGACSDGSVRLWSLTTGEVLRVIKGQKTTSKFIAYSPDGRTVATGSDNVVRLWQVK